MIYVNAIFASNISTTSNKKLNEIFEISKLFFLIESYSTSYLYSLNQTNTSDNINRNEVTLGTLYQLTTSKTVQTNRKPNSSRNLYLHSIFYVGRQIYEKKDFFKRDSVKAYAIFFTSIAVLLCIFTITFIVARKVYKRNIRKVNQVEEALKFLIHNNKIEFVSTQI